MSFALEESSHIHSDLSLTKILLAPHHGSGHFDIVDMGQSDVQLWKPATIAADRVIGGHGSVPHSYATHTFYAEQRPERVGSNIAGDAAQDHFG